MKRSLSRKIVETVPTQGEISNRNHKLYQPPKPVEKKQQRITIRKLREYTKDEKKLLKQKILSLGLEYKPESDEDLDTSSESEVEEKQEEKQEPKTVVQVQTTKYTKVNAKVQMMIDRQRANMVKTTRHRPNRTKIVDKIINTNTDVSNINLEEKVENKQENKQENKYYKFEFSKNNNIISSEDSDDLIQEKKLRVKEKLVIKLDNNDKNKEYSNQTILDEEEDVKEDIVINNNIDQVVLFKANILEQENHQEEVLITDIKLEKSKEGVRFHFDINKKVLAKSRGYTINYDIVREKLFATLHSEILVSSISRLLSNNDMTDFNIAENGNGKIIFITVHDIYNNKVVQEYVINLEGLV
jgi:hypothetical protein